MTHFFRTWLVVVLLGSGLWGCSTVVKPTPSSAKTEAEEARAAFPQRLLEARLRAWQTALEIVEAYEHIPADQCQGVAALTRDIRETEKLLGTPVAEHLDRIDANRLVTNNPNFWRAALEISPNDGSLLLLQATLLASAGEIWRANRILIATTQLLPIPHAIRPYYLAHSYGLGSVILLSVRSTEYPTADKNQQTLIHLFEEGLKFWPKNAVLLSELIDTRIRSRVAAARGLTREQMPALIEAALVECRENINQLYLLDPISAASYRGDPAARKKGRELRALWSRLADNDTVLAYKEIGELAQALEAADAPELALVLYRIQVVARGFPGPSDAAAWRRVLPKLIGPGATDALFAAADRGEINVVELNQGLSPGVEQWKGDPAIHPLVLQQVQREIADLTFQIELLKGNPDVEALALRQRGIQHSRAGLYELALEDLHAAMKLIGRQPVLLLDEAIVYAATGHDVEAESLLNEAEKNASGRTLASRERGLFRFGQGRFAEARDALRADVNRDAKASYSAIMAELAARRLGQSEGNMIGRARQEARPGSWPDLCLGFLSGKVSEDVLIREAQQGDSLEVAQKFCEAYFILAQVALAAGNQAKGLDYLESCIETGITGYVEFRLARIELKRLSPEREARTRQWEEKTPRDRPGPPRIKEKKSVEEELLDDTQPA